MRCLDLIGRLGPLTAGQLAAESGLTTGAVTFILDRLEEAGMVTRRATPRTAAGSGSRSCPRPSERLAGPAAARRRGDAPGGPEFKADELAVVRDFMRQAKEVFQRQITAAVTGRAAEPTATRTAIRRAIRRAARSAETIRSVAARKVGWAGPSHVGRAITASDRARHADRSSRARRPDAVRLRFRPHARPPAHGAQGPPGWQGRQPGRDDVGTAAPGAARIHHFDRRLPGLHGRRLAQGPRRRGGRRPRPARDRHGQDHRRRRRPAAGVGALGRQVLHARDDGHRPQPRSQRRIRRGPGQADGRRALRLRLLPALHRHVRPHRPRAAGRGVRLALRRGQGAGGDDVGRQGAGRAAALPGRLLPADRRAPHRQAVPPEADRPAARRHRGRVPQLERPACHRVPRP